METSFEEIRQLLKELAISQKETAAIIKANAIETDARFKETDTKFKETDAIIKANAIETDARFKETDAKFKENAIESAKTRLFFYSGNE